MNFGIFSSISAMVSIMLIYILIKRAGGTPDRHGPWVGEVLLMTPSTKLVVVRDRYRSAGAAERAAKRAVDALGQRFVKGQPWKGDIQVFTTPEYGDVTFTWRTNRVDDNGFNLTTPLNIYGIKV